VIEAGSVGAIFEIKDEASSVLRALMSQFERLDGVIKATKESLSTLRLPAGLSRGLAVMNENMAKLAISSDKAMAGVSSSLAKIDAAADTALTNVSASFGKLDTIIDGTKIQVGELSAELKRVGEQMALIGRGSGALRPPSLRNGTGGHGGGGGEGGGLHFGRFGGELPGGSHVSVGQKSDGFFELIGGAALLEGTKKIIEARMALTSLEAHAKAAGYTNQEQSEIMAASWANAAKSVNTTATESYKNILELAQVTGSYGEAIKMLPSFTSANAALASLKDQDLRASVSGKSQTYDFARSLELLGVTQDDAKLSAMTATITREIIGMRGLVDGSKMFQGIQNAGGSRYAWNEDFVGHVLGPLLQASPRAGAGLYQLDRSFGSGVATQQMARGAEKYGFWSKEDEAYDDADHKRFKGMKTGSIAGYDMLRSNPEEWALKVALPLFQSHGVNIDDTNEMGKAINEISRGNKNLNVILDELLLPGTRAQLAKERINIDKVPGDAGGILMANDPGLKMAALKDKWNDLMTALGGPLIDRAMAGVTSLTNSFNTMAQFFNAHPNMAKAAVDLTASAGAMLAISGAMKMTKFLAGDLFGMGSDAKLNASAVALDGSAKALTTAAERLGTAGGKAGAPGSSSGPGGSDIRPINTGFALFNALGIMATMPNDVGSKDWIKAGDDLNKNADDFMGQYLPAWMLHGGLGGKAAEALNPISSANASPYGTLPAFKQGDMDNHGDGPAALALGVNKDLGAALTKIPGDVNPTVTSAFSSITAAITAALNSMAASVKAAADAIPTGGATAPLQVHSSLTMDGKKVAQAVTTHQMLATRTAKSTGGFDGTADPSPTDYGWIG